MSSQVLEGALLPVLPGVARTAVDVGVDFAALYGAEFPRLAGYAAALTESADVGRDVAQEAFTTLFARWRAVRDPRAFVYVVATNLCRAQWRRSSREREVLAAVALRATDQPAYDPSLLDVVQRLPVRLRGVVQLHYFADLPLEEVARALHRPVGTVKRRLHEARAALGGALAEQPA